MGGEKGTQFGVRKMEFHSKYRFLSFLSAGGSLAAPSRIDLMLSRLCAVCPTFEKTSGQTLFDVLFFCFFCRAAIKSFPRQIHAPPFPQVCCCWSFDSESVA